MAYSNRFNAFMPFIFEWEGGYDNDPDDPGGETNFGIDKRSHPTVDIRNLTKEGAKEIYWREYWLKYKCEDLPAPLGEVAFNCDVNCGNKRRQKILDSIHPDEAGNFLTEQEAFYRNLVRLRPKSRKYLKGWLNRMNDLRTRLHISLPRR